MPKRTDIQSILIIGSGPIIIGQACEFDYSGTQACKALREDGYKVILVNSNPATIMTDPEFADRTYIEPLTPETLAKIIEKERPDAILPTLGGQTGLNLAVKLHEQGILQKYNVEMLGANAQSIHKAEDRDLFRKAMEKIGLAVPRSGIAHKPEQAHQVLKEIGLPCVIRPAFTLGGAGGGIAYNVDEFEALVIRGLELSMIHEILIEESIFGWKEFELEVMRDQKDNFVVICSIENVDPMGIHTGDSITVAPAQTLTDREYQLMRDAGAKIIREIGVATGGSNIQFAVEPHTGRLVVIEMNPRVSRSSALASKATGFPIAKFAAKLAVGYTLDEIPNDITKKTPASFEPSIDYCVVKIPRFAFEKFPQADQTLSTQMKSVGEVMSIGRNFRESLQKALRSLEVGRSGLGLDRKDKKELPSLEEIKKGLVTPNCNRPYFIRYAFQYGLSIDEIHEDTKIDRWFLANWKELIEYEEKIKDIGSLENADHDFLLHTKQQGYSDAQLAHAWGSNEDLVRKKRQALAINTTYKLVDTCAGEFEAYTPYYYSTFEQEDEARASKKKKIVILGGGPNRIGQGIEFDYCCVHASFALKELGYETVMVNSNPETVSTDFDTSDRLYFEPLTKEDVLNIIEREQPDGVIVQFGGQTPLNLARPLYEAGAPLIGTSVRSIEATEDRRKFSRLLKRLNLGQPPNGIATSFEEAKRIAKKIGYPVLVRPSFVLGGRAMEIVYDEKALERYINEAVEASPERPILVDKFLEDAIEVDVDAIADGKNIVIGAVMEHIEEAGIHSGDSCCVIPSYTLGESITAEIRRITHILAKALKVIGLMNIQFAVKGEHIFVLEVNPRASRTIPFVSKAIGVPLAKLAAKVMVGQKLDKLGFTREVVPAHFSVKAPVFPFAKFPGIDILLGPEMRSTGEVMGIDEDFGRAFAKALSGASFHLPSQGRVFISVKDADKREVIFIAKQLADLGFEIIATEGTYRVLKTNGIAVTRVNKIHEGRPHIVDIIKNHGVDLLINTPLGKIQRSDDKEIRSHAVAYGIPCITTLSGASAAVNGMQASRKQASQVKALQDYFV